MVGDQLLVQEVIGVDADIAGLELPDAGCLSGRQSTQVWHPELDDQSTSGRQMAGSVAEQAICSDWVGWRWC
jgi:hypothetical protein